MSQINLLSIELNQPVEFKADSKKSEIGSKTFSEVIDEHYKHNKKSATHNENTNNGNDTLLAAKNLQNASNNRDSAKLKANEVDAGSIKQHISNEDKKNISDEHTLPVPLPGEADDSANYNQKLKTDTDDIRELISNTNKKKSSDEHTLPVPLSGESDDIKPYISNSDKKKSSDEHTLPVPLPGESDDIKQRIPNADKKTTSDEYTLPVALSGETDDLVNFNQKPDIDNDEIKQQILKSKNAQDEYTLPVLPHLQVDDSSIENNVEKSAIDLLTMLGKAEKILSEHEVDVNKSKVDTAVEVASKTVVENTNATIKSMQVEGSDVENAKTSTNVAPDSDNKEQQVTQKTVTENTMLSSHNGEDKSPAVEQERTVSQYLSSIENGENQKPNESAQSTKNTDAELVSAIGGIQTTKGTGVEDATTFKDVLNVEAISKNVTKSQPDQVQSSIHKVANSVPITNGATSGSDSVLTAATEKQLNTEKLIEKSLSESPSGEELDMSIKKEKVMLSGASKNDIAAIFSQNSEATPPRPFTSALDTTARYEENFDTAVSKLTSSTVQNQKSVVALQTETISIYRKDFADQVKDKVMIMMNQKIQQVEIQLDPPEMGNVHVRVNLQNEQASVQFVVQNQQAKDALEQNMGKLREMLAENGVDVGDANIEKRQSGEQENASSSGQSRGENEAGMDSSNIGLNEAQVANLVKGSSTGVDYYA